MTSVRLQILQPMNLGQIYDCRFENLIADLGCGFVCTHNIQLSNTATAILTGGAPHQMCPKAYVGLRTEATSCGVNSFGRI